MDIKKVVKGLECHKYTNCKVCIFKSRVECQYFHDEDCRTAVFDDAISLLKEQEARIKELEEKLRLLEYGDQDILQSGMMPAT